MSFWISFATEEYETVTKRHVRWLLLARKMKGKGNDRFDLFRWRNFYRGATTCRLFLLVLEQLLLLGVFLTIFFWRKSYSNSSQPCLCRTFSTMCLLLHIMYLRNCWLLVMLWQLLARQRVGWHWRNNWRTSATTATNRQTWWMLLFVSRHGTFGV